LAKIRLVSQAAALPQRPHTFARDGALDLDGVFGVFGGGYLHEAFGVTARLLHVVREPIPPFDIAFLARLDALLERQQSEACSFARLAGLHCALFAFRVARTASVQSFDRMASDSATVSMRVTSPPVLAILFTAASSLA
jgi:hypothetical protein